MEINNETPFQVATIPSKWPDGTVNLTVIVKGTFDIQSGQLASIANIQLPILYTDELIGGADSSIKFEADIAPYKPRADIVFVGHAYVTGGHNVQTLDASIKIGNVIKTVRVIGDRFWKEGGIFSRWAPSDAELFSEMPLVYERAYGGIDDTGYATCQENTVGVGFFAKKSQKQIEGSSLPNIEDPFNLIKSPTDQPKPMGFGFLNKNWKPRIDYLGTYDDKWEKERCPDLAEDFKFDFHNAAPLDMQSSNYIQGDEQVELINLSPSGRLTFQLPGKSTLACDIEAITKIQQGLIRTAMKLDTLCIMPDQNQLYCVWRGTSPVPSMTLQEVKKVQIRMALS